MGNTRNIGNKGEDVATKYLLEMGYHIVIRNFHFGRAGEIDIIAYEGEVLCFIEVKTRHSYDYGSPLESITPSKIKKIRKVTEGYLYVNKIYNVECRFDVLAIDMRNKIPSIELLKNAF